MGGAECRREWNVGKFEDWKTGGLKDSDRLLLPSGLAGACLLLAADCAVRLIPAHNELKLGVLTALIAAVGGTIAAWAVVTYVMEFEWRFLAGPVVLTAVAIASIRSAK